VSAERHRGGPYKRALQPQDIQMLVEWRNRGDMPAAPARATMYRLYRHGYVLLDGAGIYRLSLRGAMAADRVRGGGSV
jgi:hypothetical protein